MSTSTTRKSRRGSITEVLGAALLCLAILVGANYYTTSHAAPSPSAIIVLFVEDTILPGLDAYIKRGLQEAITTDAPAVLVEIDTPGGRVDAMEKIAEALQNSPVDIYTYIRGSAASAGALIAMSGRKIAMAPGAAMGAAAPVTAGGQDIDETLQEKQISFIKAKFRAAAERLRRDGRPDLRPEIAEGMVDREMEIPEFRDDRLRARAGLDESAPMFKEKGRLVSLSAEEAKELYYCDAIVENRRQALEEFGLGGFNTREFKQMPAEGLVRFLSDPLVSSLLLLLGFLGLLIEAFTPGFGVPGLAGLAGLGLFFGSRILLGLTGWEVVFLFLLGLVLLIVELFVTPGFGIIGILGLLGIGASVVLSYNNPTQAMVSLTAAITSACIMTFVLTRFLNRRGAFRPILLTTSLTTEEGFVSADDRSVMLGATGKALTMLRPSGIALFGDDRVDVVSEGEFVPAGTEIRVVGVEGNRIVVRKIEE